MSPRDMAVDPGTRHYAKTVIQYLLIPHVSLRDEAHDPYIVPMCMALMTRTPLHDRLPACAYVEERCEALLSRLCRIGACAHARTCRIVPLRLLNSLCPCFFVSLHISIGALSFCAPCVRFNTTSVASAQYDKQCEMATDYVLSYAEEKVCVVQCRLPPRVSSLPRCSLRPPFRPVRGLRVPTAAGFSGLFAFLGLPPDRCPVTVRRQCLKLKLPLCRAGAHPHGHRALRSPLANVP